jgi:protein tyrosine phosphatase (PTP) superfamily phosphohydrolase (DUF442 family)
MRMLILVGTAILFGCGSVPPASPAAPAAAVAADPAPAQPAVAAPAAPAATPAAVPAEPAASATGTRDPRWAQPVAKPGLPNLHKVSDVLYRGAQPTAEGFRELKAMGIKTVVNLRSFHSDRDELGDVGLAYEHIYMKAWHPEDKEVVLFLQIVNDPARQPVFVHCQHGADRTGTMCALYRIALQGWTRDEALKEMTEGGFGFHEVWDNLPEYIGKLDLDDIKKRAGIKNP